MEVGEVVLFSEVTIHGSGRGCPLLRGNNTWKWERLSSSQR